ncbi:hypothetical protein LR48_Vigan09g212100 [Vigna angularis]|uniref:Uncharacterized protein n=1 Tax=Phaseolus angularis TaxID=3914 RepID=A0A0L9VEY5_PHAAN|nr:hypothetical protein LR48_Vigan09g212100 [Vigna angularis]
MGRGRLHVQKEERAPRPANEWRQQLVGGGSSHFEVSSHQETPSSPSISVLDTKNGKEWLRVQSFPLKGKTHGFKGVLGSEFLEEWKALLQDLGEVKWRSSGAARRPW